MIFDSGDCGGGTSYGITNSLRFRASGPAYLSRTPGVAGNRTTWTWSGWVKRGTFNTSVWPLFLQTGSRGSTAFSSYTMLYCTGDYLSLNQNNSGGTSVGGIIALNLLRDPSAWFHVVAVWDTNNATAADRLRLYINGVRCAVSTIATATVGLQSYINQTALHEIGNYLTNVNNPMDGYLAEVNFVDGQALDPTYFGQFDVNGVWTPKAYSGAYGTNGFFLKFNDGSSAANLCLDRSGNGNNWTPTGISVSAGATYDWVSDTPTNNYPVINSLDRSATKPTVANGGLTFTTNTTSPYNSSPSATFNIPTSGKWYFEATVTAFNISSTGYGVVGLWLKTPGPTRYVMWTYQSPFYQMAGDSGLSTVGTISAGGVVMVAVDNSSGKAWFGYNGTWYLSGDPATGVAMSNPIAFTAGTDNITVLFEGRTGSSANTIDVNFGQRPFAYTAPSGFRAMCSTNLPSVSVANPKQYFDVVLRNGTGATTTKTGLAFRPDMVWVKARSAATGHKITDAVRGVTKAVATNSNAAETTDANGLTAFTSDGYSIGSDSNYNNATGPVTYVDWVWRANGAGTTNTAGSITSTVSANTTAGFSIATGTTPASGAFTFGHGLGVTPSMVILKRRGNTSNWGVWHKNLAGGDRYILLDSTGGQVQDATIWASSPTSTVVNAGSGWSAAGAQTFVAYTFAEVPGFSKFGVYSGNSNTDGPYVHCGFRPMYVLIKRIDVSSTEQWNAFDAARDTYNVVGNGLIPNGANVEYTGAAAFDFTANGFKVRATGTPLNTSGGTYIFAAFAESPFGGSNVAPATAR